MKNKSYTSLKHICELRIAHTAFYHLSPFSLILRLTLTMNHTFIFTGDEETPAFILRNTASGVYCSGLIYSTWRSPRAPREQPLTFLYKLQSRRHGFISWRRKLLIFSTAKLGQSEKRSAATETALTTKRKLTFSSQVLITRLWFIGFKPEAQINTDIFKIQYLYTLSNLNLVSGSHCCD